MTRTRDFDAEDKDLPEKEPIEFTLKGEKFTAVPEIQGQVLIDLVKRSNTDDPAASFEMMNELFENALEDESLVRFKELLKDKKRIVTVEKMADIVAFLVEEYSNRPEAQRED